MNRPAAGLSAAAAVKLVADELAATAAEALMVAAAAEALMAAAAAEALMAAADVLMAAAAEAEKRCPGSFDCATACSAGVRTSCRRSSSAADALELSDNLLCAQPALMMLKMNHEVD